MVRFYNPNTCQYENDCKSCDLRSRLMDLVISNTWLREDVGIPEKWFNEVVARRQRET